MTKRFVILLDSETTEQNDRFREFIKSRGLGWWNWISNSWLLVDPSDELTADELRDEIDGIYPKINNLVIELRGKNDTWAGLGPNGKKRNMFTWLKKNW